MAKENKEKKSSEEKNLKESVLETAKKVKTLIKKEASKKNDVDKTKKTTTKAKDDDKTEKEEKAAPKTTTAKKEKAATKETKSSSSTTKPRSTTAKKKTTTTKEDKKETKSTSSSKKSTTTKKTAASTKKASTKKEKSVQTQEFQNEYYDLPSYYNHTVVTILSQTPTNLFVYWEISEEDRNNYKKTYGENFFEVTKPILIVYNDTLNYSFEIDINDFANSWYIHLNDSKCKYHVELGRKPLPIANQQIPTNEDSTPKYQYIPYYVYVSSSNPMTMPNNKILYNFEQKTVTYRNVKTGQTTEKDIGQFKFITNFGVITLSELYKYLFPNDNIETDDFFSGNPSSGFTSSRSLSSRFN